MAKEGLNSRQTLILAICALVGAVMVGSLLFLSNVGSYLMERGR
jgi:hypothetical protein